MAQIVGGGPPANDAERRVLRHLAEQAPADWIILHNIEIPERGDSYEIDIVVINARGVCLIDVKGTRGRVEVAGTEWFPAGRPPFFSPVRKLRGHARTVKGLLTRHRPALSRVYVDQLVALVGPEARLVDSSDRADADALHVTDMEGLIPALADVSRVRAGMARDVRQHQAAIVAALTGAVRRPTGPQRFGDWVVSERLGGDAEVTEYRARNAEAGAGETVLLRVYRANPLLPEREREAQKYKIANAYEMLAKLPPSPFIVGRRTFFATEDGSRFVLVLDDTRGQALAVHLRDPRQTLGADAKLRVFADMMRGLAHAHAYGVLHRALTPTAVLVQTDNSRALLTGFDYARPEGPRDYTVVDELTSVLDPAYVAPECHNRAQAMSQASDVYAAGVIGYQLLTGELPFASTEDQFRRGSELPDSVLSEARVDPALAALLRRMCALAPSGRPAATQVLRELQRLARVAAAAQPRTAVPPASRTDYGSLQPGHQLTAKYQVRTRLGAGRFGTVYRVYDNLADEERVIKIVHRVSESAIERLKQEFKLLLNLPLHRSIVVVREADYLELGRVPYVVFEYIEGRDAKALVTERALGPADVVRFGADVAEGLAHLHQEGIFHCDVKPANLLRTDAGCRILDFNVATRADDSLSQVGGTPQYAPPDYVAGRPTTADLVDRDLYGLGVTLYELLTGEWPFAGGVRRATSERAVDPRTRPGLGSLSDVLIEVLMRAIAPWRSERYSDAGEFLGALRAIGDRVHQPVAPAPVAPKPVPAPTAGRNPFLEQLRSLYSQSDGSNAGTRSGGQDLDLYVPTALDDKLTPAVLSGRFRLVIITGNAGDGKTAYLHRLLRDASSGDPGSVVYRDNGADLRLPDGRWLRTNHDGSQDEGDRTNDEVLMDFFGPFSGGTMTGKADETRLVAINEGRLVDFVDAHAQDFPALAARVRAGLTGTADSGVVAVINLNRRSLLTGFDDADQSVFDRLLTRMTDPSRWRACGGCPLAADCYARHNAQTLANQGVGPKIVGRLRALFTMTSLRGVQHVTMRDVGSALAYLLTSGRNCEQIHQLYASGDSDTILDGFYFNSWIGPAGGRDRLLSLLSQLDVAVSADPALDRRLDYVGPDAGRALMTIDQRGDYDLRLLTDAFVKLPRGAAATAEESTAHRRYLAAARRRFYFECVDADRSAGMLPYRSAQTFTRLLEQPETAPGYLPALIAAVNRGEGLSGAAVSGGALALQVRPVPGSTVRSYRLFPANSLQLQPAGHPASPYLEGGHRELVLGYRGAGGHRAELEIRLDLFELLYQLGNGHLPSAAERQGLYLGLTIFKNELSATPYREILLTVAGEDVRRIRIVEGGTLVMDAPAVVNAPEAEA
ncbi:methylation-associated defense system protein kinase MAD6 [Actinoplanes derwentensis]|uniref:non-specific serine/threonine protein kinase n=1 Tax=Actinoplanes derwentensis TaxID=113562 RepID=A0A1H2BS72_9ACTN|nr:serine/threonine protein kinase [Actinoplanes derwentensis]GID83027.1 protein kinase [Actinoplanes derwentensis]SDT60882.1 Serine/threonine protein kinase [Actinoplanes derwentensis]